jgi:hypothetical protein
MNEYYSLETDVTCQHCGQVVDLEIFIGSQTMLRMVQAFQNFKKKQDENRDSDPCSEIIDDTAVPPCAIGHKPKAH